MYPSNAVEPSASAPPNHNTSAVGQAVEQPRGQYLLVRSTPSGNHTHFLANGDNELHLKTPRQVFLPAGSTVEADPTVNPRPIYSQRPSTPKLPIPSARLISSRAIIRHNIFPVFIFQSGQTMGSSRSWFWDWTIKSSSLQSAQCAPSPVGWHDCSGSSLSNRSETNDAFWWL